MLHRTQIVQEGDGILPQGSQGFGRRRGKLRFLKRPHPTKGVGAWDEGNVREASSVRKEAQPAGKTVQFGRIDALCHEKGSELEIGDPERTMKGRSVLLGDHVKDQTSVGQTSVN